jgi:hypothetical protein
MLPYISYTYFFKPYKTNVPLSKLPLAGKKVKPVCASVTVKTPPPCIPAKAG